MTLPMTGAGLSAGAGALSYLLNAPFTGANQGYTDGQVLNTVAEGITAGQLTVTEVDGTLALSGNECAFTAQGTPAIGDLQLVSQSIARALGRTLLVTVNKSATNVYWPQLLWNSDGSFADLTELEAFGFRFNNNTDMQVANRADTNLLAIGTYAASTDYQIALVLGSYDASGNLWYDGQTEADYLYGLVAFVKGGAYTAWTRMFQIALHNADPVYAVAAFYDSAGTIDDMRVPDSSLSALLQPTHLSSFDAANGTSLDAITPELGTGWTEHAGNMDIQSNRANLVTGIAKSTVETGLSDAVISCVLNATSPAITAGLLVRYSDTSNYWQVYLLHSSNSLALYEINGGAPTLRGSSGVTLSSGVDYTVLVVLDGQTISCYVDGVVMVSFTSSFNQTETRHGLFCDNALTVRFDNFAVYPRTSAAYDAALDAV